MEPDDLYGLPLDRFVAERAALAKALRADGNRAQATDVAGMRKPSVAAWAVNQLVRTQNSAVQELFGAGEALREAQAELLAGRGDGRALRATRERQRTAVERLVDAARGLLTSDGQELSATSRRAGRGHAARGCARRGRPRRCAKAVWSESYATPASAWATARVRPRWRRRELHEQAAGEKERSNPGAHRNGARRTRAARPGGTASRRAEAAKREQAAARKAARSAEASARRRSERAAHALRAAQERRNRAAQALDEADQALARATEEASAAAHLLRRAQAELEKI